MPRRTGRPQTKGHVRINITGRRHRGPRGGSGRVLFLVIAP
jgi:hypothetical protein